MFTKSYKKFIVLAVAVLVMATFVFASCAPANTFTPVEMPASASVEGNGGIAVKYGDWIYYVNGYQSSSLANNDYTSQIRTGQIVRIKVADLEKIIKINDVDASSSQKTDAIKRVVAGKTEGITIPALQVAVSGIKGAEIVIPNYYYTGNTSSTELNGIYIFNDRLYMTTPNNEMDTNGNILNSQLVLASYKLDGSDMQCHIVFPSNAPELKLSQVGNTLYATYVLDSKLYSVKVGENPGDPIAEEISSPFFTGEYVYFLDKDGSICQFKVGGEKSQVIVKNEVEEGHEGHSHNSTYTIKCVNGEYVYYTVSNDSQLSNLVLFYATAEKSDVVALNTIPSGSYYGWKDKVVYTAQVPETEVAMYGIWVTSGDGTNSTSIMNPAQNGSTITFNKLEGDILYYSVDSLFYSINLADASAKPVVYAKGMATSATGWAMPDVLGEYIFTLGTSTVSVVKFDSTNPKKDALSTTITLVEIVEESK